MAKHMSGTETPDLSTSSIGANTNCKSIGTGAKLAYVRYITADDGDPHNDYKDTQVLAQSYLE